MRALLTYADSLSHTFPTSAQSCSTSRGLRMADTCMLEESILQKFLFVEQTRSISINCRTSSVIVILDPCHIFVKILNSQKKISFHIYNKLNKSSFVSRCIFI